MLSSSGSVNTSNKIGFLLTFTVNLSIHFMNSCLFFAEGENRNIKFDNINLGGNLNQNSKLEEIEAEAYQMGNIIFRKWTEKFKTNYKK